MYNIATEKVFARKLIRPVGNITEIVHGIANEVRVITKLSANGGHPNIVNILGHGWMNIDERYYVDMECCAMNLEEFINGNFIDRLGKEYFNPRDDGDGPACLRLWTIIRHISSGLGYIHDLREVHRDLKPQNGNSQSFTTDPSSFFHQRPGMEDHRFWPHI